MKFDSEISVPKIFKADDFDIYLHMLWMLLFLLDMESPKTDKNDILHPRFVYGLPFRGENWPSRKVIVGLLTTIFKYLTLNDPKSCIKLYKLIFKSLWS